MTLWQGFHHAWEYNHRLNRLGSYVRHQPGPDGRPTPIVGHTAASGTGGDTAHFAEYVTPVEAIGVSFQGGCDEIVIEAMRAVTTQFRIRVDNLELDPALVGKDTYTVVINGFDLYAMRHADKLVAFELEVTAPTVHTGGTKLRFDVLGSLCVDCRTAECQLWPFGVSIEDVGRRRAARQIANASCAEQAPSVPDKTDVSPRRRGIKRYAALDKAVNWLKRQVVRFTDLPTVKRWVLDDDANPQRRRLFRFLGKQFFLTLLKWRIATPYVLRVHYTIIAGDADALHVTESAFYENKYTWDTEHEIQREPLGTQAIEVHSDAPQRYPHRTVAFTRIALQAEMDEGFSANNPLQWGRGMHLLAWDVAVRDVCSTADGVRAQLDLFYKCWSEAMNEVITLTTWGALRAAGRAELGARLALLQFRDATIGPQRVLPGQIDWPGGGRNAKNDPRATLERRLDGAEG